MFFLEARSHANTLVELAKAHRMISKADAVPDAMEKAARFLWELTK